MKGAREYAGLFETGQYGKLYIVSSEHARGKTFRIFILPEGEAAVLNGNSNPTLNKDAVEVYGVVSGNPGWTESYGWLHAGKWQEDFNKLVLSTKAKKQHEKDIQEALTHDKELSESLRIAGLLSKY